MREQFLATPFEMRVKDVFHFSGGRTVFVGTITGGDNFIRACKCEVLVDGKQHAVILLDGEMISTPAHHVYRSLSTLDPLTLDKDLVAEGQCRLRSL